MTVLLWTGAMIAALLAAGFAFEKTLESRDRRRYPAPGKRLDIGGRRLHILCQGEAPGPTVIIEQGVGSPSVVWRPIQATIAEFARVCTYDRAGYMWSDPASSAGRNLDDMAAELRTLLERAAMPPPYVLVGHSMGGFLVRRFARANPDLVAGLVLVDSPDEPVVFREAIRPFYTQGIRMQRIIGVCARFGLLRLLGRHIPMLMLPDDPAGYALCARPQHATAFANEMRALLDAPESVRQPDPPGWLGERPLIVLGHGIPFPPMAAAMEEGWDDGLGRVARLSTDSERVVARKSGHLIYLDEPRLVVESVRRVHAAVRDGVPLADVPTMAMRSTS